MRLIPTQSAVRVIQDEHDRLMAVINGMQYFARNIREGRPAIDFKVFRAMLLYISDYPDRIHHPKEDKFLFARLRANSEKLNGVLEQLEAQHESGDVMVSRLERALSRFELQGGKAGIEFADLVDEYASFYIAHMRLEESEVLPAAQEILADADWKAINEAFAANFDPLGTGEYKQGLDKLFSLIVNIAPPPVGLGAQK